MKNGQTPTSDVARSLAARAFHRRIGLGVGVTIVALVIIAIVVFYVTRGQGAGDTPSVDGAFTDWLPQMWCSPENLSKTCKVSLLEQNMDGKTKLLPRALSSYVQTVLRLTMASILKICPVR